jgi:hypothetical protein
MSALFKKSNAQRGTTTLIVDVENSSVASALAHTAKRESPRLFGENRVELPVLHPLSSHELARHIDQSLERALTRTGKTAASLRNNEATKHFGEIGNVVVFLHAPWTAAAHGKEGLTWTHEPEMVSRLYKSAGIITNDAPVTFLPFGRAAAYSGAPEGEALLAVITGEVLELLLTKDGLVQGRATLPLGHHTVLRTLKTHAGLSIPEARSVLSLALHAEDPTYRFAEPLSAARSHLSEEFAWAASELMAESSATAVFVIAPPHTAPWLARALTAHPDAHSLLPGVTVRALYPKQYMEHFSMHSAEPDLPLMLEALFINSSRRARQ